MRGAVRTWVAATGLLVLLVAAVAVWNRARPRPAGRDIPDAAVPSPMRPAGAPPAVSPSPPAPPDDAAVRRAVERLRDSGRPVEQRRAEIEALGRRADDAAARILMAVGDEDTDLSEAAVTALGNARSAAAVRYLEGRLEHGDPKVLAAAVRALGQAAGAAAAPAIAEALRRNRMRPDGYEDTVCAACVEALGATRSPRAIPALAAELEETVGRQLGHEYGSLVVAALGRIGDARARPALLAYAARLAAEHDVMADNPMGRQYLAEKRQAVLATLDALR